MAEPEEDTVQPTSNQICCSEPWRGQRNGFSRGFLGVSRVFYGFLDLKSYLAMGQNPVPPVTLKSLVVQKQRNIQN